MYLLCQNCICCKYVCMYVLLSISTVCQGMYLGERGSFGVAYRHTYIMTLIHILDIYEFIFETTVFVLPIKTSIKSVAHL